MAAVTICSDFGAPQNKTSVSGHLMQMEDMRKGMENSKVKSVFG